MNTYPQPGPMSSLAQQDDEEGGSFGLLQALPVILWEKRWWLVLPAILGLIGGVVAAYTIPTMYESSATVLIESQQLPLDVVNSPVTDVISQRIARARERVLTRQDLIRLIRTNNLYVEQQKRQPLSGIVETMRAATTIEAVAADAGSGSTRAIALKIGFSYSDPVKAQIVAQQYVNRFLEVDASSQTDQAVGASNFLNQQGSQLQAQIAAIEGQISKIKSANGPLLALQSQSTGNPLADSSRIDAEIIGLQGENARLAQQSGAVDSGAVQAAQMALANARARYSDTHPDVIAAQNQLDAARRASAAPAAGPNPMISANNAQIASLRSAKGMILSQSGEVRAAQARGPALAAEVDSLEKKADALRDQYRDIGSKAQSAQLSARMQTEQKGERLTLADPPVVPDAPYKPNRPLLMAGGLVAGGGLGLAIVLLLELMLSPIRGTEMLREAAGSAPLVIIPDFSRRPGVIIRWLEKRNRRRARA